MSGPRDPSDEPTGTRPGVLGLATRAVHAGTSADPEDKEGAPSTFGALSPRGERPHVPPLFQTSNFVYPGSEAADAAATGRAYLYSRHGNPTVETLERAVADLEGAQAGVAFASGMGAIAAAVLGLAGSGAAPGEVLASEGIYGGSTELLGELGARGTLSVRTVPAWDTPAVTRALGPATRLVLVESLSNPLLRVVDLAALATAAKARGAALVVDSTFASPCLVRPLEHGATLVVHSLSKYISGHSDVIGGIALGSAEALAPLRRMRTLLGAALDPFAAWLALRGLRTLPLRMQRQCATAARLADLLGDIPAVKRVFYPGRTDHPDHARAAALLAAPGAMVSFELEDGAAARRCYDRVRVVGRAASLGDVASLLTHPASFSHKGVPPDERARLGIHEGLLRLSVGIEDAADLEADLRQALAPGP